ncbi:MAG: biotin--[acetyl-CoA-carboxylase] ligase [Candidatus Izimaplasma sp.]|nr:biotin--[acetyl-CoA-carboxylase] ligase [Candidatus Izimaplasma bacterium]
MIGNEIIRLESVESTNNYLKDNQLSLDDETIVVSKIQTSGRGRSNHVWMSEAGNLYFSFLLKGYISRNMMFELLVKVSNTVVKLLKDYKIDSEIKYPNDVLVKGKKICGILIESSGSNEIDFVVVGVGINVNQLNFKELSSVAISMKNIIGIETDIDGVLSRFIKYFNELKGVPFIKLFDNYLRYSLIIGKSIMYEGKEYLIEGISDEGKLIIKNSSETLNIHLNKIKLKDLF